MEISISREFSKEEDDDEEKSQNLGSCSSSSSRSRSQDEKESGEEDVNIIGFEEEGEIVEIPHTNSQSIPMHILEKDSS